MSSLRRILASRANGALSVGPATPEGKQRSSQNALRHGLLARCIVLQDESRESFDAHLAQHVEKLKPADGVEYGIVEEMAAASWRMRRGWALETRMLDNAIDAVDDVDPGAGTQLQSPTPNPRTPYSEDPIDRMAAAFSTLATQPALGLMHRYETRLHLIYQRSLHNLLLLRAVLPNEPNPISGQLLEAAPAETEPTS